MLQILRILRHRVYLPFSPPVSQQVRPCGQEYAKRK